jgi:hypothetical protein
MAGTGTGGSITVTPTSGQNFNINLATTGDFAVNTSQLYVDTSAASVGIGTTSPTQKLTVQNGSIFVKSTSTFTPSTLAVGFDTSGPDGTTAGLAGNTTAISCRTYPEKDSPFPNTAAIGKASSRFGGANLCNETKGFTTDSTAAAACECTYNKVTYGDQALIKYWSYQKPNSTDSTAVPGSTGIPNGICQGGFNDGHACDNDAGCQMDGKAAGTCLKKKRSDQLIVWRVRQHYRLGQ